MQGVQVVLTLLLQSCAFAFDLLLGPSVLASGDDADGAEARAGPLRHCRRL